MKKAVFFGLLLTSGLALANPNVQKRDLTNSVDYRYDKVQATCTITFTLRNSIGMIVAQWQESYEVSAYDFAGCDRIARRRAAEINEDMSLN